MPIFDENDEEELRKMSTGDWDLPDFSDNIPRRKPNSKQTGTSLSPTSPSPPTPTTPNKKSVALPRVKSLIPSPNVNWRSALSSNNTVARTIDDSRKSKIPVYENNDASFMDLDYDDFERAMMEVEMGGINPGGSAKRTEVPVHHDGMKSGEVIPASAWQSLITAAGETVDLSKVLQGSDVLLVYADPRRFNDEYRTILNEFRKIPVINLKIAMLAVNCDDANDLKKHIKKNSYNFFLTVDPSKTFMDAAKCRARKRLSACLMLLEVSTSRVLKVWYEGTWDPVTTKDLICEEVVDYRSDPIGYVQSQIGIR